MVLHKILFSAYVRKFCCVNSVKSVEKWRIFKIQQLTYCTPATDSVVTDKQEPVELVIPRRIHRTKTELLEALAETVRKDPTAAHYIYHDDPFLTPLSPFHSREYALSRQSGQRAARFVVNKWPKHFKTTPFHMEPHPPVPAFMPTEPQSFDVIDLGEEGLKERIEKRCVSEALTFYQSCKDSEISVSEETKLDLLQLACFYNNKDPVSVSDIERRFANTKEEGKNQRVDSSEGMWQAGGAAEKVFADLEERGVDACNLMIGGMVRHGAPANNIYSFYLQLLEQGGLRPNVTTYNCLLRLIPQLTDHHQSRWRMTLDIIEHMNNSGTSPDLHTFSAILKSLSVSGTSDIVKQRAFSVMAEMQRCDLEPGITAYDHLLTACYKLRARHQADTGGLLYTVVAKLKGKELEITHEDDLYFLPNAMRIATLVHKDPVLGYELLEIAEYGNNSRLLFAGRKDGRFYTFLFQLLAQMESIDKLFAIYNKYVPTTYIPNPTLMLEILKSVEVHEAYDYLPQLWSDVRLFRFYQKDQDPLFTKMLQLITNDSRNLEKAIRQYKEIAADACAYLDHCIEKSNYNVNFIVPLMTLLVKLEEMDLAWSLYELFTANSDNLAGFASDMLEKFNDLYKALVLAGQVDRSIRVLKTCQG